MKYILNKEAGANFRHPSVGVLPPKTAIQVSDKIALSLKDNISIIVFNDVIAEFKIETKEEQKTHEDFVIEYNGDLTKAAAAWKQYKEELKNGS